MDLYWSWRIPPSIWTLNALFWTFWDLSQATQSKRCVFFPRKIWKLCRYLLIIYFRYYTEHDDTEMDVWIVLGNTENKSLTLVITPFKVRCKNIWHWTTKNISHWKIFNSDQSLSLIVAATILIKCWNFYFQQEETFQQFDSYQNKKTNI